MLKTQKGITLIALVITIIVLLILAGVAISLTIGENGIFKTTQNAVNSYKNAADKEQHQMDVELPNTVDKLIYNVTGK